MSLQAGARTALAAIAAELTGAAVTVTAGGETTATAVKGVLTKDSDLTGNGEEGVESGVVRVDASVISDQQRGAVITVDGSKVFVLESRLDDVGALRRIEYSKTRPVTGL
jgi:hypothetical protein